MPTDFESYPDRGAIRFLKARDFGDIINATFRFLTANLKPLALGQLYVAGPALVLVTASLLLFGGMELFNPLGAFSENPEEAFETISPFIVVTVVAYVLAALLSFAAAFGVVRAYRRGEIDDLRGADVWDEARPTLLPLLGVIGLMVGLFALCIPVLIIPCLGALVILGAMVYFLPTFYLVYAVRLFEGGGAIASMKRAAALSKTNWGRGIGTVLVGLVLSYILSLVVSTPGLMLTMGAAMSGADDSGALVSTMLAVGSVLQLSALLISNTFFVVLTAFLHGSLKESSEGTLLDADLDRLAAGSASVADVLRDPADPLRDAPAETPDDARFRPTADDTDAPDDDPPPARAPDAEPRGDRGEDERSGGFRGGGFGA